MGGEGVLKICIWFLKVKRNQWVEIWWAKYCIKSHTYIATVDDFFFIATVDDRWMDPLTGTCMHVWDREGHLI